MKQISLCPKHGLVVVKSKTFFCQLCGTHCAIVFPVTSRKWKIMKLKQKKEMKEIELLLQNEHPPLPLLNDVK